MGDIRAICNLSDEQLEARRAHLREALSPQVRGREELSDGLAFRFDATPKMREELEAFVAFERGCCSGLGFSLLDAPGALRLEIRGIDPQASVFAGIGPKEPELPKRSAEEPQGRGWLRLARSAGFGAVGAFFVCCVIPIGLVALLGATLAAPLLLLDNPWVVGISAVVFSALIWRWDRRRAAGRAQVASSGGCGC